MATLAQFIPCGYRQSIGNTYTVAGGLPLPQRVGQPHADIQRCVFSAVNSNGWYPRSAVASKSEYSEYVL